VGVQAENQDSAQVGVGGKRMSHVLE
jgi:hypothetical protein